MNILRSALFALAALAFFACEKNPAPVPSEPFQILVKNNYLEIQAKYAIFITNEDSEVLAFRWLPSEDTAIVQVPGSLATEHYDCTILKLATLEAPGTGVKDTTLTLTTYTQLASGQNINLRDLYFNQITTMRFHLTGFNTLDSIVVPDALTLMRPQDINGYNGEYVLSNTGYCWIRLRINGEPFWRFLVFKNIGPLLEIPEINVAPLPQILSPTIDMNLPFVSTWQYKLDAVMDTARYEFFPLSDYIRAPGGAVPVFGSATVFEPLNTDVLGEERPYPNKLFRLQTTGPTGTTNGYAYLSDNFYPQIPTSLPTPSFDLTPTILANNRSIAVNCVGNFDVLAFSRQRSVTPKINWEVITQPGSGAVLYRLPDVPKTLADLYPALKNYDFNTSVRARAENYERADYNAAIRQYLINADPLWKARAGYLAREEAF